jgi:uncharacterized lipoprotein YddW (UPF0748 family)
MYKLSSNVTPVSKQRLFGLLLIFSVLWLASLSVHATTLTADTEEASSATLQEKRAVWISYSDIQTYLQDTDEAAFRRQFEKMCDKALQNKLNTLIVHVRPMGDAIYPSDYYPWSTFISSKRKNPGYDPLAIMIEIAHAKGLKLEAWINPYRISNKTAITRKAKKTAFYKKYKSCILSYTSGGQRCLALDPAKTKARNLIVNGVREIVERYDVDGIHMDDYFYVSGMKDRLSAKKKRKNVNKLVQSLYATIKAINPNCEFGISPSGNLDNARAQGADIDTWLSQDGYVDYVMPQIYWSNSYVLNGKNTRLYSNRASQWYDLKTNDNVKLYVGLALYRVGTSSSIDRGWGNSSKNLQKQYEIASSLGYDGYALFTYSWLNKTKAKKELRNLRDAVESTP